MAKRQSSVSSFFFRFFFQFSAVVFRIKQRILQGESFWGRIFFAFVLLILELIFAIISLPIYFLVPPQTLQEKGFFFPSDEVRSNTPSNLTGYTFRRKVGMGTILGASGIYAAKVLLVTTISFFLIGAPTLLADTQTWTFATPSDYTYDSAKLEITGGVAQLKDVGVPTTGATTNPDFNTNKTGWTNADWLDPGQATAGGARQTSGGNTGGYVDLALDATKGTRTIASLWRQSFTTTVASPDTATLTFDRKIFTYTSPTAPVTYQLYAFIDTASGDPTLGQQIWSSGEITSTSAWVSVPAIDIRTKVAAAGTYYVKVAAYVTTPVPDTTYSYIAGLDNIQVSWSKANVSYSTTIPSLAPNTSLNPAQVLSWSSFTETATKNGGELYYQLSDDDGASWKYWNAGWVTAGAANYTTAAVANTNISSFPLTNNKIRWKAFFSSNGTQQVILNNVAVGYTQNTTPSLTGLSGAQQSSTGRVNISYTLTDTESDSMSLSAYEYSLNGTSWSTMTAATGDPAHQGVSGLSSSPSGVAHTFVWDAFTDLGAVSSSSAQVRLRPNDGVTNGTLQTSATFAVDYVNPIVSNVSAVESAGNTNVTVTYDLSDASASDLLVQLEASSDGGSSWVVPTTSATGAVGSGVTTGTGKTITWNAGTDYSGYQLDTMKVRVRAKDTYQNQGDYANSSNFSLDTLAPAILTGSDLQSQPHAGDSAVTVSGTFTEANPSTNGFYVALGSGVYGSATAGSSGTATPPAQAVSTSTLNGDDYITKVKVAHTDVYGTSTTNENTSPTAAYAYVKPYTPIAPTVTSPGAGSLDVVVNKNVSEATGLEYAIYETSTSQYVQAGGALDSSAVWQTIAGWSTVTVSGLTPPLANYSFETKSRNTHDGSHAASSESSFSPAASISNGAPSIALGTITQPAGTTYIRINYTGTDAQNDISSLTTYEYSTDGSGWHAMTEKSGVGSDGTTGLAFTSSGVSFMFAWDVAADLPDEERDTVFVRLQANDGVINGNMATSSSFATDTRGPIVSNVSAVESTGSTNVTIIYDLADQASSNINVELEISNDSGSTWVVPSSSVTGSVGSSVAAGVGKTITWDAGTDYSGYELSTMQVHIRGMDSYLNQGSYTASSDFSLDTLAPAVLVASNIDSQPHAGNTSVLVSGTFTETNPDTNQFYVALGSGSYGSATAGATGTATPSAQAVTTAELKGDDYITKTKVVHTDAHGQSTANENTSPSTTYVYVKPYVPAAPTVLNPAPGSLSVAVNKNASEVDGLKYAIYETSTNTYVQANATLGASAVWQTITTWGTVTLTSLPNPVANYAFETKSRNTNDGAHAASSESDLSSGGSVGNSAPAIALGTVEQSTGASYVSISYTGTDAQNDVSSLVAYEYSTDGAAWHPMAEKSGVGSNGTSGLAFTSSGASLMFAWDVAADLPSTELSDVSIRLQARDGVVNGNTDTSSTFAIDTRAPAISNLSVAENSGNTNVVITYDLADISASTINVELEISSDSGASWTVPTTSATGAVGSSVAAGTGKTITWDAAADFASHQLSTMRIHLRARDIYMNQGAYLASSDFALDTLAPAILAGATIASQPHAGATTVSISGTFTEANPNTNEYYIALGGGAYGSVTAGPSGTATPTAQAMDAGATLNGSDVVTKVKIVHTDTHGQSVTNENTSLSAALAYVKPYTPLPPTVTSPGAASLAVTVNKNASETDGLEYAIYETSTSQYLQGDGTLGGGTVWQTLGMWSTATLAALPNPLDSYSFETKSRNSSDTSYNASSESALSPAASTGNTAPSVTVGTITQPTGMSHVTIGYTGTDTQNNTSSLVAYEYSTDGAAWHPMTEKSGVGSDGTTGLAFTSSGASLMFAWDIGTDLPGVELSGVSVRLQANDGIINGNLDTSSTFAIDTRGPTVSNVSAAQAPGSTLVGITYNLADQASTGITVGIELSSDGGATWTVPVTSATGAVGSSVTTGIEKTITWDAGVDFVNQFSSNMLVRFTATDSFANAGALATSSAFAVDTLPPAVSTLLASQTSLTDHVAITYDLSDDTASGLNVTIETSSDGGTIWTVATTLSGNTGSGQTSGSGKSVTWNAGTDLPSTESSHMRVRVKASDAYGRQSNFVETSDFVLDTAAPTGLTTFTAPATTTTTATYSWSSGVADSHFDHYELWYGTSGPDVNSRSGSAVKWSAFNDTPLATNTTHSTTIPVLTSGTTYFAKIWAVDTFGHEVTLPAISVTLPTSTPTETTSGGAGTPALAPAPVKPTINTIAAFTQQSSVAISGGATGSAHVDLYDNGTFLKSLTTTSSGAFQGPVTFEEGNHSLSVRSISATGNASEFSNTVAFTVDMTAPHAPIITSPTAGQAIEPGTFIVTGSAELDSTVELVLDNTTRFSAPVSNGVWSVEILPTYARPLGAHTLSVIARDQAGNKSSADALSVKRVQATIPTAETVTVVPGGIIPTPVTTGGAAITPEVAPGAPGTVAPATPAAVTTPTPSLPVTPTIVQSALEATTLAALPTPVVSSVLAQVVTTGGGIGGATGDDLLRFSGSAIPNQDVIVYIHSDQALTYRAKADRTGAWTLDHSQGAVELSPGEHTIYAVSVDPVTQIKSRPSSIRSFTVTRSFWANTYRHLNLYTTIFTILTLLFTMTWLIKIQKRRRGV